MKLQLKLKPCLLAGIFFELLLLYMHLFTLIFLMDNLCLFCAGFHTHFSSFCCYLLHGQKSARKDLDFRQSDSPVGMDGHGTGNDHPLSCKRVGRNVLSCSQRQLGKGILIYWAETH